MLPCTRQGCGAALCKTWCGRGASAAVTLQKPTRVAQRAALSPHLIADLCDPLTSGPESCDTCTLRGILAAGRSVFEADYCNPRDFRRHQNSSDI